MPLIPDSEKVYPGAECQAIERLREVVNANLAQHNLGAAVRPTVDDDDTLGYASGSLWIIVSGANAEEVWGCITAGTGAALWVELTGGGGGGITGPRSTIDNGIVLWDGTDGTAVKDSGVTLADLGAATPANTQNGTLLYGSAAAWVEGFPMVNSEGLILTNAQGLIVFGGM